MGVMEDMGVTAYTVMEAMEAMEEIVILGEEEMGETVEIASVVKGETEAMEEMGWKEEEKEEKED
jgi:hypothetical protein